MSVSVCQWLCPGLLPPVLDTGGHRKYAVICRMKEWWVNCSGVFWASAWHCANCPPQTLTHTPHYHPVRQGSPSGPLHRSKHGASEKLSDLSTVGAAGGEGKIQLYLISKSQELRRRIYFMCQGHISLGQKRRVKVQLERREWVGANQQSAQEHSVHPRINKSPRSG